MMSIESQLVHRLCPHVTFSENNEGTMRFFAEEHTQFSIKPSNETLASAYRLLKNGITQSQRDQLFPSFSFELLKFDYLLQRLLHRQMLELVLAGSMGDRMIVLPQRESFSFNREECPKENALRLSRFAYLHRGNRGMTLDLPESSCSLLIAHHSVMNWIFELSLEPSNRPTIDQSEDRLAGVELLWKIGYLEQVDQPESNARKTWEFHDWLFHHASRPGKVLSTYGGSYRFEKDFPSPPAEKPRFDGPKRELSRPNHEAIAQKSDPLYEILERRRSHRAMGDPPISLEELTELLYRVARIILVIPTEKQELLQRVTPSGGAVHEIEFYLSVRDCQGLEPGFYHYHGFDHALYFIASAQEQAQAMINQAGDDWGQPQAPPQIVVTLASRFPRLAWKYDTAAYRATLFNAGVIVQTLYLVADDMGLACTPAGRGGDPRVFAQATGLDPFIETSIFDLGLGSRDNQAVPLLEKAIDQSPVRRPPNR